ncbi:GIY-YIG nuclease family protein [Methylobacter psychrophilus]|uniref:GIY-YIG nuclease family protein n=1 Tax=Methylobacter psychrophilus TaxID=96941 RepID=UPI0021D4AEFA|nr:GIY-YIG nuclease family protein [Methylobacter psychrophilus]
MANNKARSIKIFLLDGDPDGVRTAEIDMSTIQAIAFRRSQLARVKDEFKEISRPGVYLLLGTNPDDPDSNIVYIGESDDVARRLYIHNSNHRQKLEFWTDTIALVSKDENLTKSHARYVEAILIKAASENNRWKLINDQQPTEAGKLPRPDAAAMNKFIEQSKTITGTLGWDLFKPVTGHHLATQTDSVQPGSTENLDSPEFSFSGGGFSAKAIVSGTTGNWIIKENSIAKLQAAPKIPESAKKYRNQLIADGILIENSGGWFFQKIVQSNHPRLLRL